MVMTTSDSPVPRPGDSRPRLPGHQPGDLVYPVKGYPQLCEVLVVEAVGLMRIRAVGWAPGYTILVRCEDYRLVTGRLSA